MHTRAVYISRALGAPLKLGLFSQSILANPSILPLTPGGAVVT